jgi:hypothetical protein
MAGDKVEKKFSLSLSHATRPEVLVETAGVILSVIVTSGNRV